MADDVKHGVYAWDFNPRTPCGVRPGQEAIDMGLADISIHALHAECDQRQTWKRAISKNISIHALHAECDKMLHVFFFVY